MLRIIDRFTSFIEGKTHESWHNKFKELYEIELEAVINEELKPKEGISMVKLLKSTSTLKVMRSWFLMWDNTKCLPAGMPNSILLKVMLLLED
jgi:hypothetical protein